MTTTRMKRLKHIRYDSEHRSVCMDTKNLSSQATEEIEIKIKKILLPIDGSSASLRAARYAVKIAKQENAEIICIHAIANLHYPPGFGRFSTISQTFYIEGKKLAEHWFLNAKTLGSKGGRQTNDRHYH